MGFICLICPLGAATSLAATERQGGHRTPLCLRRLPNWGTGAAGHDADIFAVPSGGNWFNPGDSGAIPEHLHPVDGLDDSSIVTDEKMNEAIGLISGQRERVRKVALPRGLVEHTLTI